MTGWFSAHRLVARSWGAVFHHRHEFVRICALPAVLWLVIKVFGVLLPHTAGTLTLFDMLTSAVLALFVIDWFRFSLRLGAGQSMTKVVETGTAPLSLAAFGRGGRMLVRITLRIGVVVLAISAILLLPTIVLAAGALVMSGQFSDEAEIVKAVSLAMPLAAVLASPWLVRFYVYYATLAAGRSDVGARDVWRWSRGKSLWLLVVLALSLAPGGMTMMLVDKLAGEVGSVGEVLAYILAMPVFFLSLAVMASVTAKALSGLVLPPVME